MIVDKINKIDCLKFFIQWIFSGVMGIVLCLVTGNKTDFIFVNLLMVLLYLVCYAFLFIMFYGFEEKELHLHQALTKSTVWFCILLTVCVIGHLLPYSFQFYMLAAAVLCAVLPIQIGLSQSFLILMIIQLCGKINGFDMIFGILLIIFGMMCSVSLTKKKHSFESLLILTGISVAVYFLCNYAKGFSINQYMVVHGLLEGLLNFILLLVVLPFFVTKKEEFKATNYGEAIEDDFPMVLALKGLSDERYQHGRRVSLISYHCGKLVGLNENLVCCAGLYYGLGDETQPDPTGHLLDMAEKYNLPLDVRRLLQQYKGLSGPITTPEAALVDLVDTVVTNIEEKGNDYQQGFNRQMLIMNIFEELSSSGRYDESGLSINRFLKIRKFLLEEAEF